MALEFNVFDPSEYDTAFNKLDDERIYVTEDSTYSFTKNDIALGHHKLVVAAMSSDGVVDKSDEIEFVVANYAMPTVCSDGMILQRNKPIKVGGTSINGKKITASINDCSTLDTVSDGDLR